MIPRAHLVRDRRAVLLALVLAAVGLAWSARHVVAITEVADGNGHRFAVVWLLVFASLVWHIGLSWLEVPVQTTPRQQRRLDNLKVVVNVPVYNEDPEVLEACLTGLLNQSRLPARIEVVDDGSEVDYDELRWWFLAVGEHTGVEVSWRRTANRGKRHAQLATFQDATGDIFVTMDSDVVLDRDAIQEGLKPFSDPKVMSVAGVILALNSTASLLVRITNPWLLMFQLGVRSALSILGSVLVNSGNYALYRAEVIRDGAEVYATETFFGRPVVFSDDSLLTTFAYLKGRTVQQPTAFGFAMLPENVSHHLRQQLRWMRGSTIRSLWRFRYLPVRSIAYWEHFASWANFVLVGALFVALFVVWPLVDHRVAPYMLVFSVLAAYATALRCFLIRRSDEHLGSMVVSFALAPLMLAWSWFVLRPLRLYAMATCWKTGWGTRTAGVEVALDPAK